MWSMSNPTMNPEGLTDDPAQPLRPATVAPSVAMPQLCERSSPSRGHHLDARGTNRSRPLERGTPRDASSTRLVLRRDRGCPSLDRRARCRFPGPATVGRPPPERSAPRRTVGRRGSVGRVGVDRVAAVLGVDAVDVPARRACTRLRLVLSSKVQAFRAGAPRARTSGLHALRGRTHGRQDSRPRLAL